MQKYSNKNEYYWCVVNYNPDRSPILTKNNFVLNDCKGEKTLSIYLDGNNGYNGKDFYILIIETQGNEGGEDDKNKEEDENIFLVKRRAITYDSEILLVDKKPSLVFIAYLDYEEFSNRKERIYHEYRFVKSVKLEE